MSQKNFLLGGILFLASYTTLSYADYIPYEWKTSGEGIVQWGFEGAYLDQSNNLAELTEIHRTENAAPPANLPASDPLSFFVPILEANPDYDWAYTAKFDYIFASRRYDVRASYTWLRSSENQSVNNGTVLDAAQNPANPMNGHEFHYNFDEAEITIGKLMNPTEHLLLRGGVGVVYAHINQKAESFADTFDVDGYFGCPGGLCATSDATFKNKFEGAGPKITLDGYFDLTHHLFIAANGGASLLYGRSTAKLDGTSVAYGNYCYVDTDANNTCHDFTDEEETKYNWVVGLDAKASLGYAQTLNEGMAFSLDIGYQATTYLNALQDDTAELNLDNTQAMTATVDSEKDYYNYGPFVNFMLNYK